MLTGMRESPKNVYRICLVFSVVLFMSPEMMLMTTIMLLKIQYTRSLCQILMGSIGMSRREV
jgi:hypothetical protein